MNGAAFGTATHSRSSPNFSFVNIDINLTHLIECIRENFAEEKSIALVSTIQFVASLQVSPGISPTHHRNLSPADLRQ
jgi:diphthamide synthase subunit DPH2